MDVSFAQMEARVDAQMREAEEHAKKVQEWATQVESVQGEGRALRGAVRVCVNRSGVPMEFHFGAEAMKVSPQQLSQAVMEALKEGQKQVMSASSALAASAFGEDSETTTMFKTTIAEQWGLDKEDSSQRRGPGVL